MNLLRGLRLSVSRPAQGLAGSSRLCARLGAVRPLHAAGRPSSALLGEGGVLRMRWPPSRTSVRMMSNLMAERDERAGEARVARFRHIYDKLARGKLISKKDLKHGIEQTLSYSVRIAASHFSSARAGLRAAQAAARGWSCHPATPLLHTRHIDRECACTHHCCLLGIAGSWRTARIK
jgi:hypothetical protein